MSRFSFGAFGALAAWFILWAGALHDLGRAGASMACGVIGGLLVAMMFVIAVEKGVK